MKKVLSRNRKVRYDYFVEDDIEAGLILTGSEVKSLRQAQANIDDAYVVLSEKGKPVLLNCYIKEYEHAGYFGHEPRRSRGLLLKKKEIEKMLMFVARKGYSLIPTELYFFKKWVKIKVAFCRSKKKYDKRDTIKDREVKREMDRVEKSFKNRK